MWAAACRMPVAIRCIAMQVIGIAAAANEVID
jgi:hypothetical protein